MAGRRRSTFRGAKPHLRRFASQGGLCAGLGVVLGLIATMSGCRSADRAAVTEAAYPPQVTRGLPRPVTSWASPEAMAMGMPSTAPLGGGVVPNEPFPPAASGPRAGDLARMPLFPPPPAPAEEGPSLDRPADKADRVPAPAEPKGAGAPAPDTSTELAKLTDRVKELEEQLLKKDQDQETMTSQLDDARKEARRIKKDLAYWQKTATQREQELGSQRARDIAALDALSQEIEQALQRQSSGGNRGGTP